MNILVPVIRLQPSAALDLPKVSERDQLKILHSGHTRDRVASYAGAFYQGELKISIRLVYYIDLIKKITGPLRHNSSKTAEIYTHVSTRAFKRQSHILIISKSNTLHITPKVYIGATNDYSVSLIGKLAERL